MGLLLIVIFNFIIQGVLVSFVYGVFMIEGDNFMVEVCGVGVFNILIIFVFLVGNYIVSVEG